MDNFKMWVFRPSSKNQASFFIQSHGLHAGRPLKKPIANCFGIATKAPYAYEKIYVGYVAKKFSYYIHGSCCPFIRLKDAKDIVNYLLACKIGQSEAQTLQVLTAKIKNSKKLIQTSILLKIQLAKSFLK